MKLSLDELKKVKKLPTRISSIMLDEDLELFKKSIDARGIIINPLLAKIGDELYIIDGHHRIEEAILGGRTSRLTLRNMTIS